jgi:hypothetical protein
MNVSPGVILDQIIAKLINVLKECEMILNIYSTNLFFSRHNILVTIKCKLCIHCGYLINSCKYITSPEVRRKQVCTTNILIKDSQ